MQVTLPAATGRELHHAINPSLAEFDLAFSRQSAPPSARNATAERDLFLARAQAVIATTLKGGC